MLERSSKKFRVHIVIACPSRALVRAPPHITKKFQRLPTAQQLKVPLKATLHSQPLLRSHMSHGWLADLRATSPTTLSPAGSRAHLQQLLLRLRAPHIGNARQQRHAFSAANICSHAGARQGTARVVKRICQTPDSAASTGGHTCSTGRLEEAPAAGTRCACILRTRQSLTRAVMA